MDDAEKNSFIGTLVFVRNNNDIFNEIWKRFNGFKKDPQINSNSRKHH